MQLMKKTKKRVLSTAALVRALQVAATRNHMLELVTILTDCQAAIGRMTSDEPGPGQKKALEARRHIATLRAKEPNVKVEIRWCPSHKGIDGNEIADEWAKLAADESDAHGVEWLSTTNPDGTVSESLPVPEVLRQRQARVLRKEMAERQRLGQEEACPHQQPQIPAKRKAETGPRPTSASPLGFTS